MQMAAAKPSVASNEALVQVAGKSNPSTCNGTSAVFWLRFGMLLEPSLTLVVLNPEKTTMRPEDLSQLEIGNFSWPPCVNLV